MNLSFQDYAYAIADYIDMEYGNVDDGHLSDDEKYTIKNIIISHYEDDDSINNAANIVVLYLRESRAWIEDNINE